MTAEPMATSEVTWIDDRSFTIGTTRFTSGTMPMGLGADEFLIVKPPELTTKYIELLADEAPQRIVELGVKEGGSTAMMALLADPELLLAVDLAPTVPSLLIRFIEKQGLAGRVHTAFGIDQADRESLITALAPIKASPLDLVIDDASHILGPTRASFEVLFPLLRPGGLFIVEDWSSECTVAHTLAEVLPEGTNVADHLDVVNHVFHILNSPEEDLPQAVKDNMTRAATAEPGATTGPTDLFQLLATAASSDDISDLIDLPVGGVRPVADLAVELTMLTAVAPDVIAELSIDQNWIAVRRGEADLSAGDFTLDSRWTDFFGYLPQQPL